MTAESQIAVHIFVHGRVQGVGYRAWTERIAHELGLNGWMRNRRDGTVEAVFAGDADLVAEMLERCRSGPDGARVTRIERVGEGVGTFDRFEVRPTH